MVADCRHDISQRLRMGSHGVQQHHPSCAVFVSSQVGEAVAKQAKKRGVAANVAGKIGKKKVKGGPTPSATKVRMSDCDYHVSVSSLSNTLHLVQGV